MKRGFHESTTSIPPLRGLVRTLLIWFTALAAVQGSSAQSTVPIDRQLEMMMKVISSAARSYGQHPVCSVGILYSHHDTSSAAEQTAIVQFSSNNDITLANGIPVRFISIDLGHGEGWKELFRSDSLAAVIVTSVPEHYLEPIALLCREESILSMTTVPDFVRTRLAVGVTSENDRAILVVNVPVSLSEGTKLSSRVLKMAKIYR
jgi:hypothetical protein